MVKFQIPKKLSGLKASRSSSSSRRSRTSGGGIQKPSSSGGGGGSSISNLQSSRSLASIRNLVTYFKNGKKKPASDKLNENQQLEWSNLDPGSSQAPSWLPKQFIPFWAAGKATATLVENAPEIVSGMITGKGFTWEGSNYIGPNTDLSQNYQPMSQMDDLARIHDYQYGQLQEAGVNPYFTFNQADKYMLDHVNLDTPEGWAIYVGIGLKQIFPDDYTEVSPVPPFTAAIAGGGGKQISTMGDQQIGMTPTQQLNNETLSIQRERMFAAIAEASKAASMIGVVNRVRFMPGKTQQQQQTTTTNSDYRHRLTFLLGGPAGVTSLAGGVKPTPRTAGVGGTPTAPVQQKQSSSLQQSQFSLPSVSKRPRLSSFPSRDLMEPSAPLFRAPGPSTIQKYSMMRTPRNYQTQTFMLDSTGSSGGVSIPSFVKR